MKTKRLISAIVALAITAALAPMSAIADTMATAGTDGKPTPPSASLTVKYAVEPTYTVTIPAGVELSDTAGVTGQIKAEDVVLAADKKITVKLTAASNTTEENAATFNAMFKKDAKTSTVNYTISKGSENTAIKLGDTVAEFDSKTGEQTETLTFTKDANSKPAYAEQHTEVLTFTLAVTDAEAAPVGTVVDLSDSTIYTGNFYTAKNGDIMINAAPANKAVKIADGATVTLKGVDITQIANDSSYKFAGITCEGDATILLVAGTTNSVKCGYQYYPGIFVPQNKTLTIDGTGTLNAQGSGEHGLGAGIGGGFQMNAGNIVINGGTINAQGPENGAGIGSGCDSSIGTITINGGTITAVGGEYAAGIGCGYYATGFGDITIRNTVTSVKATKGSKANQSIGKGSGYKGSTVGTVTIEDGANVTQN